MHILRSHFKQIARTSLSLLLCAVLLYTTPGVAFAQADPDDNTGGNIGDENDPSLGLSEEQLRAFDNQIFWYNTEIAQLCAGEGGTALVGIDNIEKAYNFFITKGLTKAQSAGILGNLIQESGVIPTRQQGKPPSYVGDGKPHDGVGFGIAQWTWTSRQAPLEALAKKQNKPVTDLGVQLDYMWGEMNGSHQEVLEEMKKPANINNVANSAFIFHKIYEVSSDTLAEIQERVDSAMKVFENDKYRANNSTAAGGLTGQAAQGSCGGVAVDGYYFPVAPQTKRNYSNMPCTGRKTKTYVDIYDNRASVPACHHDYSPAFDLMYSGVDNAPVYAISDAEISRVNYNYSMISSASGSPCGSMQIQIDAKVDPVRHYYWYGHILPLPGWKAGDKLKAGQMIGKVAPKSYGTRCWGGGPHLHIDRGCVKNPAGKDEASAQPHTGGNDNCRDPQFITDLKKIWDGLPLIK